jgi:hypothetical protein
MILRSVDQFQVPQPRRSYRQKTDLGRKEGRFQPRYGVPRYEKGVLWRKVYDKA